MKKSIAFQPSGLLFRFVFTVGLIGILILVFFSYVSDKEQDIEKVVLDKTVKDINAVLSILTYKLIINNRIDRFSELVGKNPFDLKDVKDLNIKYGGLEEIGSLKLVNKTWYFDKSKSRAFYFSNNISSDFKLLFKYQDRNGNNQFDKNIDDLSGLVLE